jgi:8-oxo-dGTP pyrophosphatase MutT (NUDIX family)
VAACVDAAWLAHLQQATSAAPLQARLALVAQQQAIGSVLPGVLDEIGILPASNNDSLLLKIEHSEGADPAPVGEAVNYWQIDGDVSRVLNHIAQHLRAGGNGELAAQVTQQVCHLWRDEQLAVTDAAGRVLGSVERGVVRLLGIATRAVHLVGQAPDGRYWVQQRSLTKANDPGLWDCLMGGMVSAQDTVNAALARETWEEAGLRLADLQGLQWGGRLTVRKPSDALGLGYMVETTDWFRCTVPHGLRPVNQDGEVAQFELLTPQALVARLQADAFTPEAALILAQALALPLPATG